MTELDFCWATSGKVSNIWSPNHITAKPILRSTHVILISCTTFDAYRIGLHKADRKILFSDRAKRVLPYIWIVASPSVYVQIRYSLVYGRCMSWNCWEEYILLQKPSFYTYVCALMLSLFVNKVMFFYSIFLKLFFFFFDIWNGISNIRISDHLIFLHFPRRPADSIF